MDKKNIIIATSLVGHPTLFMIDKKEEFILPNFSFEEIDEMGKTAVYKYFKQNFKNMRISSLFYSQDVFITSRDKEKRQYVIWNVDLHGYIDKKDFLKGKEVEIEELGSLVWGDTYEILKSLSLVTSD